MSPDPPVDNPCFELLAARCGLTAAMPAVESSQSTLAETLPPQAHGIDAAALTAADRPQRTPTTEIENNPSPAAVFTADAPAVGDLHKFPPFRRSGAKYQFPELLRAKGDLLLRLNPHDDAAENWLRQGLMAARDEGTKSLELRAALSLARLYRAHQRERKARDVLAPIYAWFTEGFATRDLVEAKDLLDQLP